jgi:shikimate kinase
VVLVGLMGSGKSTVGRLLAERLACDFVDTDDQVEQATGSTVNELFATHGEASFRRYELDSLTRSLARPTPAVIATGGGVVTTTDARRALRHAAMVVWLRASPEALAERLDDDDTRPLLGGRDPRDVLHELHEHRASLYDEVAQVVVDVDQEEPARVADRVLELLGLPA